MPLRARDFLFALFIAAALPCSAQTNQVLSSVRIIHRDDVIKPAGRGGLWNLINTPEVRMNYVEITSRGKMHIHPDADHRLYVLEGRLKVLSGTNETIARPNDLIIIPKGVPHAYDVTAPGEKALLLTFDAPPYDPQKTLPVAEPQPGRKNKQQ